MTYKFNRVLSVRQPWAGLLVLGIKQHETRSWNTRERGTIAIHASATQVDPIGVAILNMLYAKMPDKFFPGSEADKICRNLGCIVGTVVIRDTYSTNHTHLKMSNLEKILGDYSKDRHYWVMKDPTIINPSIPAKGQLGFWSFDNTKR